MLNIDETKLTPVGENINCTTQGKYLIMVVDTTIKGNLSSTGKMRSVGNTGGFALFPNGLKGNIYIGEKVWGS